MKRTTTILLLAIGLLLVGVAVTRTPGQQVAGPVGACCYPSGGCVEQGEFGCITTGGTYQDSGTTCAESDCTPLPTVVSITSAQMQSPQDMNVYRQWSDGQLDRLLIRNDSDPCEIVSLCVLIPAPGICATDVNRDGMTGITDFLTLLEDWGPCR